MVTRASKARRSRSVARRAGFVICAVPLLILQPSCGYHFATSGLNAAVAGRRIQVVGFQNASSESNAGVLAHVAVARALAARGATITEDGAAGAILTGTVESLTAIAIGFAGPQSVSRWRVDARLRLELHEGTDPAGKRLAQSVAGGGEEYLAGLDVEGTEVSRRTAIARLMERLGGDAVDRLAP